MKIYERTQEKLTTGFSHRKRHDLDYAELKRLGPVKAIGMINALT